MMDRLKTMHLSAIAGFAIFASMFVLSGASFPLAADESDHDRARIALEAGEIVSLDLVLSKVESMFEGNILEVELEEEEKEFWDGGGEKAGEHVEKGKNAFPGVSPVDDSAAETSDAQSIAPVDKPDLSSNSGGGYAEGEGAVAGNGTRGNTTFIYKVKLLSPQGNVLRIEFNAKSMEILGISGRDPESARKRR